MTSRKTENEFEEDWDSVRERSRMTSRKTENDFEEDRE